MGKRSKSCSGEELPTNKKTKNKKNKIQDISDSVESQPDQVPKKKNKSKKVLEETKCETVEIVTPRHKLKNKKKIKLDKSNDDAEENKALNEDVEVAESNTNLLEPSTKKKAKTNKKNDVKVNKELQQNKKIVFTDDEPVEVSDLTNNSKKNKNKDLSQEEDVKDEDIDKFCEEIDEEDNVQYENWVKLIEAKLNSNKKKPK